jgi:hypothetical protein
MLLTGNNEHPMLTIILTERTARKFRMALRLVGQPGGSPVASDGRHRLSRKIRRNGGNPAYRANLADRRAWDQALRPKRCRLSLNTLARSPEIGVAMVAGTDCRLAEAAVPDQFKHTALKDNHSKAKAEKISIAQKLVLELLDA